MQSLAVPIRRTSDTELQINRTLIVYVSILLSFEVNFVPSRTAFTLTFRYDELEAFDVYCMAVKFVKPDVEHALTSSIHSRLTDAFQFLDVYRGKHLGFIRKMAPWGALRGSAGSELRNTLRLWGLGRVNGGMRRDSL